MLNDPSNTGWNLDHSYAALPSVFYTRVQPSPVSSPKLIILNERLARELGLNPAELARPENAGWFTGNTLPPGASPIAQAYAGHQFGNFTMLGDGRAILLGEQLTPRGGRFDIQLKGPGRTPYSRGGDGRAAIGPMLREYLISEAMQALGIPTTRSLAVAATGDPVYRETTLPGAILTRVAASHIRVGTFEFAAVTGDLNNLRALADYTIRRHYPTLAEAANPAVALLEAVLERQAKLVARWQSVGFIHGVMNTDNMALSGETIDYGPCAFMDTYNPATVFSSIDHYGRYAYQNQPKIAHWNLSRLASAMLPLLHENEDQAVAIANESLRKFSDIYQPHWINLMRAKIGLSNSEPGDATLIEDLLNIMLEGAMDFTNTFRDLSGGLVELNSPGQADASASNPSCNSELNAWRVRWLDRVKRQPQSLAESQNLMRRHNPAYIPRNHKVEEALAAAVENNDLAPAHNLLKVISNPYNYKDSPNPEYSNPAPTSAEPYQTYCGT